MQRMLKGYSIHQGIVKWNEFSHENNYNTAVRGDGRKEGRLFFSCRITQGVDREEENIRVWAQTHTGHPPAQ